MKRALLYKQNLIFLFGIGVFFCAAFTNTASALTITADASSTSIEVGESVQFNVNVLEGEVPYTYEWAFDDIESYKNPTISQDNPSPVFNASHVFEYPGKHYVKVEVTDSTQASKKVVLIIDVAIDLEMPVFGAVIDIGCDDTGVEDCTIKIEQFINELDPTTNEPINYDPLHGIRIEFPSEQASGDPATYRFNEKYSGHHQNICAIRINNAGNPKMTKIAFVGKGNSRPTLLFYDDNDTPDASHSFFDLHGVGANPPFNTYILISNLQIEMSEDDPDNYTFLPRFFSGGDIYARQEYKVIEDCTLRKFAAISGDARAIHRRNNITHCGDFDDDDGAAALFGYPQDGLSIRNYIASLDEDHSHIWYPSNSRHNYIIDNFVDFSKAHGGAVIAQIKSAVNDAEISGNLFVNYDLLAGAAMRIGKYRFEVYDVDISDNRIIGMESGIGVYACQDNVNISNNFFSQLQYDSYIFVAGHHKALKNPTWPEKNPDWPAENPDWPEEDPNWPENPSWPENDPNWPEDDPNWWADDPNLPEDDPDWEPGLPVLGLSFRDNIAGYGIQLGPLGLCDYGDIPCGRSDGVHNAFIHGGIPNDYAWDVEVSGTIDNDDKYLSRDPSGWYDENGYLDPGPYEYIPPSVNSFQIEDNGQAATVTLNIDVTDSGSGMGPDARFPYKEGGLMQFSNDGITWSQVEPYSTSHEWTLSDGDGFNIVYARFRDRDGNWTGTATIPVANDDTYTLEEDEVFTVPAPGVMENDIDAQGKDLRARIIIWPEHAHNVALKETHSFAYVPLADFNGQDSFTYELSNDNNGKDIAQVFLTINAVNDAPVALHDSVVIDPGQSEIINLLANASDAEGDSLTINIVGAPGGGVLVDNGDGTFTYSPNDGYTGTDSFTYTVTDGQLDSIPATVWIAVGDVGELRITARAGADEIEVGDTVRFDLDAEGGTVPYAISWSFDDVESFKNPTTAQNPSHRFDWPGRHYVKVEVTDSAGETKKAVLIIDVAIDFLMPVVGVKSVLDGAGEVISYYFLDKNGDEVHAPIDEFGNINCAPLIEALIQEHYDRDEDRDGPDQEHGLKIEFPSGTYRFDEIYSSAHDTAYAIDMNNHSYHPDGTAQITKIAFVGTGSQRPTLVFYDDFDAGRHHTFFFLHGVGANPSFNTYVLVSNLQVEMELDPDMYTHNPKFFYGGDRYERQEYQVIEDCSLKNFGTIGSYSRTIHKRNNITHSGNFDNLLNASEGIRYARDGLSIRNYIADLDDDHSHIWYFSSSNNTYLIDNYADMANGANGKIGAQLKREMRNTKVAGNIIRNAVGGAGAYFGHGAAQAYNVEFSNNKFLDCESGLSVRSSSGGVNISNNFFTEIIRAVISAGHSRSPDLWNDDNPDNDHLYPGLPVLGVSISNNVMGYNAPSGKGSSIIGNPFEYYGIDLEWDVTVSGTIDYNERYPDDPNTPEVETPNHLLSDPPGWYDENGYVDPKPYEYNPPTVNSFLINNGAERTNSQTVTLSMDITDSGSGMGSSERFPYQEGALMQFSNDGMTWAQVELYSGTHSWQLSDGNGQKTVYARFRDRDGNWSNVINAAIRYDTSAVTTYTINASVDGVGGTISPLGAVTVNDGENQIFTLTPDDEYTIRDVLVDGVSQPVSGNTYAISNITRDHTIAARFDVVPIPTYTISVSVTGTGGSIDPSGEIEVVEHSDVTFTITPDDGYEITDVLVDGVSVDAIGTYTFEDVTEDGHTIEASFVLISINNSPVANDDNYTIDEDTVLMIGTNKNWFVAPIAPDEDPDTPDENPHLSGVYGRADNEGNIDSPWDIELALTNTAKHQINPGDTIWLRGGTYYHPDRSSGSRGYLLAFQGSSEAPITVRAYPGERVTIDGGLHTSSMPSEGPRHVRIQDLEIIVSENLTQSRITSQGGSNSPADLNRPGGGISVLFGHDIKFVNNVVHTNTGGGFGFWSRVSGDSELYGNLIYDNGWVGPDRNHGHGIYSQNGAISRDLYTDWKYIRDNISFDNSSLPGKSYGTSSNAYYDRFVWGGNVLSRGPWSDDGRLIIGGETNEAWHIYVLDNILYKSKPVIGYNKGAYDVVFAGNTVLRTSVVLNNCRSITEKNNLVWEENDPIPDSFPLISLRPNEYDSTRANLVIVALEGEDEAGVDFSPFLNVGQSFKLLYPHKFYNTPAMVETYTGGSILVPTAREFTTYVVVKHDSSSLVLPHDDGPLMADMNTPATIHILANDSGFNCTLDPGSVGIIKEPDHGSVVVDSNGIATYTSDAGFFGVDTFSYEIYDLSRVTSNKATVMVNVSGQAAAGLNFNGREITYYGGNGYDVKGTWDIEDNGMTLHIVGNRWKALELPYYVTENTVLEFDFMSGAEGETHGIGLDTNLRGWKSRLFKLYGIRDDGIMDFDNYDGSGAITHYQIPIGNYYTGLMKYIFFANDHDIADPTAESVFSNIKIYEAIIPDSASFTTRKGFSIKENNRALMTYSLGDQPGIIEAGVLDNDIDSDAGDSLTATLLSYPSNGTLSLNDNGSFAYTPNADFDKTDTFTYVANDGESDSNEATVTITVQPKNEMPQAHDDLYNTTTDTAIHASAPGVLSNDTDADGDTLSAILVIPPSYGTVDLDGNGAFTYTPNTGFHGADGFTYRVNDGTDYYSIVATTAIRVGPQTSTVNFNDYEILSYGGSQDAKGPVTVEDNGATLHFGDIENLGLGCNRWKAIELPHYVDEDTILEFDFRSTNQGEIHSIGFDANLSLSGEWFKLYGTQDTSGFADFDDYDPIDPAVIANDGYKNYKIPVGQFYTGLMKYLFFGNDHDVDNPTAESYFSNIRIYEESPDAPTYIITASAHEGGSISPDGEVSVRENRRQTFSITSDAGYAVDYVSVDGSSIGRQTSYTFTSVRSTHSIDAYFVEIDRTPPVITLTNAPQNGSTVDVLSVRIQGTVTDNDSLSSVTLNGNTLDLNRGGDFNEDVTLTAESLNTITIRAVDASGNTSTLTLNIYHQRSFTLTADRTSGIAPLEVTFTASLSDTSDIILYEWDFDGKGQYDERSNDDNEAEYTFTGQGTYPVTLRALTDSGASITRSVSISVEADPAASPVITSIEADVTQGTAPLIVSFTQSSFDPDGEIQTYEWDFDGDGIFDVSSDVSGDIVKRYTLAGTYISYLKITDDDGLTHTRGMLIEVLEHSLTPTVTLDASYINNTVPITVNFAASASGGTILRYEWDFDGNGVYDIITLFPNVSYTYENVGTFTVSVKVVNDKHLEATASVDIRILGSPPDNAYPNLSRESGPIPLTVDFGSKVSSITGASQYLFDFDGDLRVDLRCTPQTLNTAVCIYKAVGTYKARILLTGGDGWRKILTVYVHARKPATPGVYIKLPKDNWTVSGSRVMLLAKVAPKLRNNVDSVQFQYRLEGQSTWIDINDALTKFPCVMTKWDTTSITDDSYEIQCTVTTNNTALSDVPLVSSLVNVSVDNSSSSDADMSATIDADGNYVVTQKLVAEEVNEVSMDDGTNVSLPYSDMIPEEDKLTVETVRDDEIPKLPVISDITLVGVYRKITLSQGHATFTRDVEITIPYGDADIDLSNEKKLKIFYYNEGKGTWEAIFDSMVIIDEKVVKAKTHHFSLFGLGSGGDTFDTGDGIATEGCFIATAAYGTPMANEVKVLSEFRDKYLLKNDLGRQLVKFYYNRSPRIADKIRENSMQRKTIRGILKPVVWLVRRFCN